jgi:hypothetical protein
MPFGLDGAMITKVAVSGYFENAALLALVNC